MAPITPKEKIIIMILAMACFAVGYFSGLRTQQRINADFTVTNKPIDCSK